MSLAEDIKTFVKANKDSDFVSWWDDIFGEMGLEEVQNEIVDQRRWSTTHEIIVKRGDEFARILHAQGSTEMQENDSPIDELSYVKDVRPVEKTIISYVEI